MNPETQYIKDKYGIYWVTDGDTFQKCKNLNFIQEDNIKDDK